MLILCLGYRCSLWLSKNAALPFRDSSLCFFATSSSFFSVSPYHLLLLFCPIYGSLDTPNFLRIFLTLFTRHFATCTSGIIFLSCFLLSLSKSKDFQTPHVSYFLSSSSSFLLLLLPLAELLKNIINMIY